MALHYLLFPARLLIFPCHVCQDFLSGVYVYVYMCGCLRFPIRKTSVKSMSCLHIYIYTRMHMKPQTANFSMYSWVGAMQPCLLHIYCKRRCRFVFQFLYHTYKNHTIPRNVRNVLNVRKQSGLSARGTHLLFWVVKWSKLCFNGKWCQGITKLHIERKPINIALNRLNMHVFLLLFLFFVSYYCIQLNWNLYRES